MRVLLISLLAAAAIASAQSRNKGPALDGNDPVLLTEGKEVDGLESLSVKHAQFEYRFSSAETRDRFNKDPERYAIQLDGACARMGAGVTGDPSAYIVYNGRIYIAGSQECYKHFKADPKKYLESEQPEVAWDASADARAKGRALMAKVLAAMGGADRFKGIQNYSETRSAETPNGKQTLQQFAALPDSLGIETSNPQFSSTSLILPEGVFRVVRGEARRISGGFGSVVRNDWSHELLAILTSANRPDFDVFGDAASVTVKVRGVISTLVVNPGSGLIDAIVFHGRGQDSAFGERRLEFSDYREAGEFKLPFHVEAKFDGQPVARQSYTVEAYKFNSPEIAAHLKAPEKIRE